MIQQLDGALLIPSLYKEAYGSEVMPKTAENIVQRLQISREKQDEFALRSQRKAKAAIEQNKFANEIAPVELVDKKGNVTLFEHDEHVRGDVTMEQLAKS